MLSPRTRLLSRQGWTMPFPPPTDRAIDLKVALKARHPTLDHDQRVDIDAHRPIDRIKIERTRIPASPARFAAIRKDSGDPPVQNAFALDRAHPGPQLATEIQFSSTICSCSRCAQTTTRLSTMSSRSIDRLSSSLLKAGAGQSRRPVESSPAANSAPRSSPRSRAITAHHRGERELQADAAARSARESPRRAISIRPNVRVELATAAPRPSRSPAREAVMRLAWVSNSAR